MNCITATPQFMKIPLTTNKSYNQIFLMKISIHTIKCNYNTISNSISIFHWRNSVTIVLQQKHYLAESLSTCWREYIPPSFTFAIYNHMFRTCHVHKLGSTKTRTVMAQFWVVPWYVSREWGKPRTYQSQWPVLRPSQKWKQECHQCEWFQ
jgi:hypothetical protein